MLSLRKGRYAARLAVGEDDLRRALELRHTSFVSARHGTARPDSIETDAFDRTCRHVLVEETETGHGRLVCCFRLMPLQDGSEIGRSYSAQYYELSALRGFDGRMVEMGRFCIHPDYRNDPDILRVAWGAMTRFVDAEGVEMLFGCSSFEGTEARRHHDAFALLRDRHIAPGRWRPRMKAPQVYDYARALAADAADERRGMLAMPALLRGYLTLGGWVSDHAVIDPILNTLHVFTGLEIRAIPPARARLLRAIAA